MFTCNWCGAKVEVTGFIADERCCLICVTDALAHGGEYQDPYEVVEALSTQFTTEQLLKAQNEIEDVLAGYFEPIDTSRGDTPLFSLKDGL